jgi:hypothetical protein
MKKQLLLATKLIITAVVGSLLMAQPTLAQLGTYDSDPSLETPDNNNPFSQGNTNDFNPLELIHRANFGTATWNAEQQDQKLDSEAAKFRNQQQQLFQQKPTSGTSQPTNNN